jgi:hypothetical protein
MSEEEKEPPRGFRVTDRRRFSEGTDPTPTHDADACLPEPEPASHTGATEAHGPLDEPLSFSTSILGLSTQALLHLGEIADPLTGQTQADLAAAKHVIDILGILQSKTRNNLEQAEERLLDAVLYDLRLKYVELVRGRSKEEA